jgi:hypothetical protein
VGRGVGVAQQALEKDARGIDPGRRQRVERHVLLDVVDRRHATARGPPVAVRLGCREMIRLAPP